MGSLTRASAKAVATLVELRDPPEYATGLANGNTYGQGLISFGTANLVPVLETGIGTAWTSQRRNQMFWFRGRSVAGARGVRGTNRWLFPVSCDLTTAPAAGVYAQRWELEAIIARTTPLVANAPISMGVTWNAGGGHADLNDTASAGYELISNSTINGGRWTVRRRLTDGAAVTVVADTGLDPVNFPGGVHVIMRLDSGVVPRLSFIVNGVEFGAISGLAAMPFAASGNFQTIGVCQGLSVGGGANQDDFMRQNVFRLSNLS